MGGGGLSWQLVTWQDWGLRRPNSTKLWVYALKISISTICYARSGNARIVSPAHDLHNVRRVCQRSPSACSAMLFRVVTDLRRRVTSVFPATPLSFTLQVFLSRGWGWGAAPRGPPRLAREARGQLTNRYATFTRLSGGLRNVISHLLHSNLRTASWNMFVCFGEVLGSFAQMSGSFGEMLGVKLGKVGDHFWAI